MGAHTSDAARGRQRVRKPRLYKKSLDELTEGREKMIDDEKTGFRHRRRRSFESRGWVQVKCSFM